MSVKKSVGKGVIKSVEIRGTDPEKRREYFLKRSFVGDNCQICSFCVGTGTSDFAGGIVRFVR